MYIRQLCLMKITEYAAGHRRFTQFAWYVWYTRSWLLINCNICGTGQDTALCYKDLAASYTEVHDGEQDSTVVSNSTR